jgi:hypothetical protein
MNSQIIMKSTAIRLDESREIFYAFRPEIDRILALSVILDLVMENLNGKLHDSFGQRTAFE